MPAVGDGAFLADLPAGVIDELLALAAVSTRRCRASENPPTGRRPRPGDPRRRPPPPKINAQYAMFAGGFPPTPGLRRALSAAACER